MKRSVIISTLVVVMSLVATSMFAVTVGSVNTNNITTTVVGSCKWITPLTMAFPNYDPLAVAATTQSTSVNFKCVKKTNATDTYKIWFNKSAGTMVNGVDNLNYTLTNAAFVAVPTTIATAATIVGVAGVAGAGYSYTVNGSIAAGQDVSAALTQYVDTVVANIEY
jgi:hypothetical protein